MKYRTVEEVIDFVSELTTNDTADSELEIRVAFYYDDVFVGELVRNMCSYRTDTVLKGESLLYYLVTDFKVEEREYCVVFVLDIKKPSSI